MPFDNISPDKETDYFSDGLTEELTARLSAVGEIELVSRWATKQMKERTHDVHAMGSELGARYIVAAPCGAFRTQFASRSSLSTCRRTGSLGKHLQGQTRRHLRYPGAGLRSRLSRR